MTWAATSISGWLIAGMRTIKARHRMVRHGWKATACRASSAPDRGKTIRATFDPPTVITTTRPCASPRGKAGEAVVCLRSTRARRHDYGQEHGLDEDDGLENQECSQTRTRAIGARKSEPDATPENGAPASSETFRQGARA